MRLAETVTFGGSGLDRAAHLRGDTAMQGELLGEVEARFLAVWRGKPLFADGGKARLEWLKFGHPVFDKAVEAPLFLGLADEGYGLFAQDISAWEPDDTPEQLDTFFDPTEQLHPDTGGAARFAELRAGMARLSPRDAELAATARSIQSWHRSHRYCSKCGAESAPTMAGWQRDCPKCKASHFPRTDPVVIMLITHGNSVLVGRSPGWPEGMFSLLAGFVEPGETIEAAVRREVYEEAGVKVGQVGYLASQPWPYPSSLMIGCQGEATSQEIKIDPKEIEEALWVSREDMADVFAGAHPRLHAPREGAIAQFLLLNWLADRLD
ncbi:MAG: NAD(+) diphosphatase [Paracoccaceae bacterium]